MWRKFMPYVSSLVIVVLLCLFSAQDNKCVQTCTTDNPCACCTGSGWGCDWSHLQDSRNNPPADVKDSKDIYACCAARPKSSQCQCLCDGSCPAVGGLTNRSWCTTTTSTSSTTSSTTQAPAQATDPCQGKSGQELTTCCQSNQTSPSCQAQAPDPCQGKSGQELTTCCQSNQTSPSCQAQATPTGPAECEGQTQADKEICEAHCYSNCDCECTGEGENKKCKYSCKKDEEEKCGSVSKGEAFRKGCKECASSVLRHRCKCDTSVNQWACDIPKCEMIASQESCKNLKACCLDPHNSVVEKGGACAPGGATQNLCKVGYDGVDCEVSEVNPTTVTSCVCGHPDGDPNVKRTSDGKCCYVWALSSKPGECERCKTAPGDNPTDPGTAAPFDPAGNLKSPSEQKDCICPAGTEKLISKSGDKAYVWCCNVGKKEIMQRQGSGQLRPVTIPNVAAVIDNVCMSCEYYARKKMEKVGGSDTISDPEKEFGGLTPSGVVSPKKDVTDDDKDACKDMTAGPIGEAWGRDGNTGLGKCCSDNCITICADSTTPTTCPGGSSDACKKDCMKINPSPSFTSTCKGERDKLINYIKQCRTYVKEKNNCVCANKMQKLGKLSSEHCTTDPDVKTEGLTIK